MYIISALEENTKRTTSVLEEDAILYNLYKIAFISDKCEVTIKDMIMPYYYLSDEIKQLLNTGAISKPFASLLCKVLKPRQFVVYTQLLPHHKTIKLAFDNYFRQHNDIINRDTMKDIPRVIMREVPPVTPLPPKAQPIFTLPVPIQQRATAATAPIITPIPAPIPIPAPTPTPRVALIPTPAFTLRVALIPTQLLPQKLHSYQHSSYSKSCTYTNTSSYSKSCTYTHAKIYTNN